MEHTYNAETYAAAKKEIWKITWILSALTLVELAMGFWMYLSHDMSQSMIMFLKGTILILMMVKAFYIVSYFMHLKHEIKNMIMTIVVPLLLFVWFIISFLYEGNSYKNLKNRYDKHTQEQSTIKVQEKHHGKAAHEKTAEPATAPAHH
ncbi:MAG: cytochrome C oxidase subunit IV family protein [Chitinophagaceae bacterium]